MASNNGGNVTIEKGSVPWKPKVFIGSSSKAKDIAHIVKGYLDGEGKIEVVVWDKLFKITETYIERLTRTLEECDFAILIITKEGDDQPTVRQNVLFELGLFMGRLGRYRTIMLYDEQQQAILPSDLGGIHRAIYSTPASVNEYSNVLKTPCEEIRNYILDPYEDEIHVSEVWKKSCNQVYETLNKAPRGSKIKIIQTWFPDLEDFVCRFLFKLLFIRKCTDD